MTFALHVIKEIVIWGAVGASIISAGLCFAIAWANDRNHRQLSQGDR